MRPRWTCVLFAASTLGAPLAAQTPVPVTMPSGKYVIQARDTARAREVAIVGWPFVLTAGGAFTIMAPDTLTFTGKLAQKDGVATYTDQSCDTPALYRVRRERSGYALDFQSGGCPENGASLSKLLFVPGKPKK